MDNSTAQLIAIIITLFTFAVLVIIMQFIRRRRDAFTLRRISAYRSLARLTGEGIEASRPLHLSFGSAGIGGAGTPLALASAEFFYHVTQEVAIGDMPPIVTLTDTTAIPLAQDTLRRGYRDRDRVAYFRATRARWYPAGRRSLAYAAAIAAMQSEDNISANIFAGSQGAELALMIDAAYRRGVPVLATSDQLEGQAVAFALADESLIGEEIFTAGSYFSERANQAALAVTTDLLRWVLIVALIGLFILLSLGRG